VGLLEIKCTTASSVTKCDFLVLPKKLLNPQLQLKRNHEYYYQVMGQMGITGASWCDCFVYARDDYHVERIVFDESSFAEMMTKLSSFFYNIFATFTKIMLLSLLFLCQVWYTSKFF
jgi:hypothetical protein